MNVVGVDGCKRGWIAAVLDGGQFVAARVLPRFGEVLAEFADAEVLAVDIPIGLPVQGVRVADIEARKFLGSRRSTVFITPPRGALAAETYEEALAITRDLAGFGLSAQAYGLARKILEVDACVTVGDRIHEIHPEVSFLALAQGFGISGPLPRKKTWNGVAVRRRLLDKVGITIPNDLREAGEVAPDDVLDAAVAAWSAMRIAGGEAKSLPEDAERDERGRQMAIWY